MTIELLTSTIIKAHKCLLILHMHSLHNGRTQRSGHRSHGKRKSLIVPRSLAGFILQVYLAPTEIPPVQRTPSKGVQKRIL